MDQRTTMEPPYRSRPSRGEVLFIVGLTLVALVLRAWNLSRVSIEHFDEAIYASNLLFGEEEGYAYPGREFFAPPLFPFLVETVMIFTGVSGTTAMYVNVLFGSLTIPLLWYVGRTWFGPVCGVVAAVIACGYDFHIFYSRTALTDILLCVWWLLAVWAYERSFTWRSAKFAVVAGVFSGLAWATKYNGWITWLIAVTGGLGYVLFSLKSEPLGGRLKLWGMVCGVSAAAMLACWYPVWNDLQDVGGYGAVAANHRGYFVGFGGWIDSLLSHTRIQRASQGVCTVAVAVFAWMAVAGSAMTARSGGGTVSRETVDKKLWSAALDSSRLTVWLIASLAFVFASAMWSVSFAAGVVGLLTVIWLLLGAMDVIANVKSFVSDTSGRFSVPALWLLGAWSIGLLLATPLYQPYPRLLLPWLTTNFLAFGLFAAVVHSRFNGSLAVVSNRRTLRPTLLATIAIVVGLYGFAGNRLFPAWPPRLSMEHIAARIRDTIQNSPVSRETVPPRERAIVYVWGEPAIVFHLRAAGGMAVPVADWGFLGRIPYASDGPAFLVVGPHFEQSSSAKDEFYENAESLELAGEFAFTPSDLVAFDRQPPSAFGEASLRGEQHVLLYRVLRRK